MDKSKVTLGSYLFALLLSLIVGVYSFDFRDGGIHAKEEPPVLIWIALLPMIGGSLSIEINPDILLKLLSRKD